MKTSTILICLSVCVAAVLAQPGSMFPGMPGGLVQVEHSEARPIALFAVGEMGSEYRLVAITRREAQIVQGYLYHLTLLVNKTTRMGSRLESCEVQVHEMPWLGYRELISRDCTPQGTPQGTTQGNGYRLPTGY